MSLDDVVEDFSSFHIASCSSEMRDGRRGLSLLEITLEIILYTTLHKDMGQKTSRSIAFSCFGIKAMNEALRALKIFLDFLESSTASSMSYLTIYQQAFPFFISLIASLTSSSDTGLLTLWFSSLVTNRGIHWVKRLMNLDLSSGGLFTILRKCCTMIESISLWATSSIPWDYLRFVILLCALWAMVVLWKNFVFLFPSLIHCILDFCFQKISYCKHRSSHSLCKASVSFCWCWFDWYPRVSAQPLFWHGRCLQIPFLLNL